MSLMSLSSSSIDSYWNNNLMVVNIEGLIKQKKMMNLFRWQMIQINFESMGFNWFWHWPVFRGIDLECVIFNEWFCHQFYIDSMNFWLFFDCNVLWTQDQDQRTNVKSECGDVNEYLSIEKCWPIMVHIFAVNSSTFNHSNRIRWCKEELWRLH